MSQDSLLQRPQNIDEFFEAERPMVIAHRGFSGKAPENTSTAVRMAMDLGADMVEIDVTLSSDEVVIVLHDDTLDRTTDGTGLAQETSWEDIQTLDAGSWFDRRFAGEPVPSLAQILDLVKGQILINIEIKAEAVGESPRGGIEEKVAEEVRKRDMVDQVIVSSFNPRALVHLHEVAPEIRSASLYNRNPSQGSLALGNHRSGPRLCIQCPLFLSQQGHAGECPFSRAAGLGLHRQLDLAHETSDPPWGRCHLHGPSGSDAAFAEETGAKRHPALIRLTELTISAGAPHLAVVLGFAVYSEKPAHSVRPRHFRRLR